MSSRGLSAIRNISSEIILFGIAMLFFIWTVLYYQVQSERQLEIDNAIKETASHARMFEEHTVRTIRGLDQIALFLKYQVEKEGWAIDIPRLVSETRFAGQPFVLLSVDNENGDVVANSQVPFVTVNIMDREHFQVHKEVTSGKLFISKPVLGRVSGKMSIQLTRRINKADGSFGGIVVVSVDPYYFAEFYKQVNLGKNSSIALVGRDGIVRVQQTDKEIGVGMDFHQNVVMDQLSGSDGGNFVSQNQADGIKRIYSYRALQEYPLVVVVGISEAKVLQALNQRMTQYYWQRGAMSVVIIGFVTTLLVGIARRKEAEEMLRCSQARYHALVEQSFEALALVDIETQEVVEVNRRFTDLFGYSLPDDEPLFANQVVVDSKRNLDRLYNITLRQQHLLPTEPSVFRHKNGTKVPVERSGTIIRIDGRDFHLASMRDMTEVRRHQAELIRDVEVAHRVQRGLLPELPESSFVTIRTIYQPSHFVSGDSYHLEWRNDGKLLRGFLLDVSGHGLATALQTASVNVLLREATTAKLPLLDQIRGVNAHSAKYFAEGTYAAMLGFELDLSLRELRYVGAGITQFYTNGTKILTPGLFVGMLEDEEFTLGTLPIMPGDTFYFLTDGLTDLLVQPENAHFWSPEGKDFDADVVALEKLAGSGRLRDDATGICLKVTDVL